ncbi:prodigiosin synthesizing transferase PigC-like isoform X3 [Daktulosphaira vitifoliae]|uniref:prodigiosin synthesizing transferase PigC-like isoform X3 n=1 Tax=Daktulosphaira vitifoliae TaxID=58002 RepID=UPI0021AAB3A3|nr:prodigiosin synthesizing transferase PigC-like isoform X3 [Daktulosphaira vitifoliae]
MIDVHTHENKMEFIKKRICYSSPTSLDTFLDDAKHNNFRGFLVFFGHDKADNTIIFCINQDNQSKKSELMVYYKNTRNQEFFFEDFFLIDTTNIYLENSECYDVCSWKMPSIIFQCLVPMQSWRIAFNGCLKSKWKPFGFPVYCDVSNDFFKKEVESESFAIENLIGFDQFGVLSGTIVYGDKMENVNLTALKIRRWKMSKHDSIFAGKFNDNIAIVQKCQRMNICRGHLKLPEGHEYVTKCDIKTVKKQLSVSSIVMQHNNSNYIFNLNSSIEFFSKNITFMTGFENGQKGIFFYFENEIKSEGIMIMNNYKHDHYTNSKRYIVKLNSELCLNSNVVGNKARSLSLLNFKIKECSIKNVSVPSGICIKTEAMYDHIEENENLIEILRLVIKKAKENNIEELLEHCEKLKVKLMSTRLSEQLTREIFKNIVENQIYAVRSSGTLEDGDISSSAGQYLTKLGSIGIHSISTDILECWASNFSAQALIYRINNGQPLFCGMAVIVQKLIDADVAGVLFTRDPQTGDPERITINFCKGIGECVVSGTVTPETLIISRESCQTISEENECYDNENVYISGEKLNEESINKNLITSLCLLCLELEEIFGSSIDIEWAIKEADIFLLQLRPITSIFAWSDNEILHEFDSPFSCKDVSVFYNTKDVFPGALHPLSLTLDFFSLLPSLGLAKNDPTDIYNGKQQFNINFNCCLNLCQLFQYLEVDSIFSDIIQYSIAGKLFVTNEIWQNIKLRRKSKLRIFLHFLSTFQTMFNVESKVKNMRRKVDNINIKKLTTTSYSSIQYLSQIKVVLKTFEEAVRCHMDTSTNNVISHTLVLTLGLNTTKEYSQEYLTKLASSINNSNAVSLLILKHLMEIANALSQEIEKTEFCKLPLHDCHNWIKSNSKKCHRLIEDFIVKFGHRGVQELDVGCETWSTDHNKLYSCIQKLVSQDHYQPNIEPKANDFEITSFYPNGGFLKKYFLNYLLTRYRNSITYRELSKDLYVLITHKLRLCYLKLGQILVDEGKMIDPKLLFFMSQYELEKICHERDTLIVYKALMRKKMWPKLSHYQFEDVNIGFPIYKLPNSIHYLDSNSTRFSGCPIYPGHITNRACILESVDQAEHLKSGDILIVKSIDVAWSIYFPIISGLVTEIGGIISHGAVVAREYRVPCIVGVTGVTKSFKTGDMVILDSENGFLQLRDT